MLSTYINVLAWNRVHLISSFLRSLFPLLSSSSSPNLFFTWPVGFVWWIDSSCWDNFSGKRLPCWTANFNVCVSLIYKWIILNAQTFRSFGTHNKYSAIRKFCCCFINFRSRLIADYRTRWRLGSIICLRFDNLQPNNVQNVEDSPRLCGYRHWDTLGFSHPERWWDAIWFSPVPELIFLII